VNQRQQFIVAGGGIGGLAVALALARRNFSVTVLEQSGRLGEIGAGIQIGPNAFHALDYLGVGEAARRCAVFIDRLVMMDSLSGDYLYHADGVTRLVRNAVYGKREPEEWYRSLQWLYGGTGLDSTV
jgi:glycine/D-amino acid oxidase-like deaminating enzyme